jgi:hypothetical protein
MILAAGFRVHTRLGPGLFESVYQRALAYELKKAGFQSTSRNQNRFFTGVLPRPFQVNMPQTGLLSRRNTGIRAKGASATNFCPPSIMSPPA